MTSSRVGSTIPVAALFVIWTASFRREKDVGPSGYVTRSALVLIPACLWAMHDLFVDA